MGYVNTGMGDRLSALLVSLMALQLTLVDQNPFGLVKHVISGSVNWPYISQITRTFEHIILETLGLQAFYTIFVQVIGERVNWSLLSDHQGIGIRQYWHKFFFTQ